MNIFSNISKSIGKNKLLATSYIWLIVVPLCAKVLTLIESPLDFSMYVPGLIVNISLPFSWQLFYFSAVIISFAGVVYYFACPSIIKSFATYAEFQNEGRDASYLAQYAEHLKKFSFKGDAIQIRAHTRCLLINRVNIWQRPSDRFMSMKKQEIPWLALSAFPCICSE